MISSLDLVIKYGADVTVAEAQKLMMISKHLKGQVPVPEIFGWTEDENQVFIYMSLIEGETLQEKWCALNENERLSVCEKLKCMAKAWRSLKQDGQGQYVGNINRQPLNEIFLLSHPELAGPFEGLNAVQNFQDACGIEINGKVPIFFTHDDLVPSNIILSSGSNPRVAAIIDWGQSGWYPAYWEYCKARRVKPHPEHLSDALEEEWHAKYLPMILDTVDYETIYCPWLYFVLSKGI